MRRLRLLLPVLLLSALTACGAPQPGSPATTSAPAATSTPAGQTVTLNIFAAASLTEAFQAIGKNFEAANPGTGITFNFGGSQQLAQQIGQGAPVDVFASANKKQMDVVIQAGKVISGTERTFVRNRLVVIYPRDNPAGLKDLKDLAKPGAKIVLAAKDVPVGGYSLDFLARASKQPEYTEAYSPTVLANVVSYEENVRAVLSKVVLGEADAGIVYTSDISLDAADKVGRIDIPDSLNTIAAYPIAPIKDSQHPDLAQKFVEYVLSPDAQTILVKYGFIPTTGSPTGGPPAKGPLAIGGKVDRPLTLTVDDLKQKEQVTIKATDRGGTEQTYQGVPIAALLEEAGVQAGAQQVVFSGGDGYSQTVALKDLGADKDAIIAILADGSLRNILPTQPPRVWVKGLIKLEVQ